MQNDTLFNRSSDFGNAEEKHLYCFSFSLNFGIFCFTDGNLMLSAYCLSVSECSSGIACHWDDDFA